jgi:hypothetical protein
MSRKLLPLYKSLEGQKLKQALDDFYNAVWDAVAKDFGIPRRFLTGTAPTKVDNERHT